MPQAHIDQETYAQLIRQLGTDTMGMSPQEYREAIIEHMSESQIQELEDRKQYGRERKVQHSWG